MSKKVLMVEDQIEFRAIHGAYLQQGGYRVVHAGDGEEAVRAARDERPDVILMDYSIPRLNGIEATRRLKADPDTAGIPVVLVTAHSYGTVGRRARQAGCHAFLSKPCDPKRILQEVHRIVGN